MLLHTVVSEYAIFYEPPGPMEYRRQGESLFQGRSSPEGLQIERILSTDPADYLRYAPGELLPNARPHTER
ncbi:MAG: hypothetical protein HFE43_04325 [Oscillospiraceae bacterium]|jgi:hypothetical protein|nr:hypothetical protein [Oscillospiraceae bacterium]